MRVDIKFEGVLIDLEADQFETYVQRIEAELRRLDCEHVSVRTVGDDEVVVEIGIEAASLESATPAGTSKIRSAIHAAEIATPDWDIEWCSVEVHRSAQAVA